MRCLIFLPLIALLPGCSSPGITAVRDARLEFQESAEKYKACLAARGPQNCEAERLILETDERKYGAVGSVMYGNSSTANVTVRSSGGLVGAVAGGR